MSRVGQKPIEIPPNVEVKVKDRKVWVKGPKGELSQKIPPKIGVKVGKKIIVSPQVETNRTRALWGLTRSLISNMIQGVLEGFEKKLELRGVGYRAKKEGDHLVLQVGFTHPIKIKQPSGIEFSVKKNVITVSGIDKQMVGQLAAKIREIRPPEPYKGKGIRYVGEKVKRKVGKKAVTTETE